MKAKILLVPAFILLFTFISFSQDTSKVNETIKIVQKKFIPDKRLGVYNISYKIDNNDIILTGETDNKNAIDFLLSELGKNGFSSIKNNVSVLPDESLKGNTEGIIKVSVANMRKHPDHDYEMLSQAIIGTKVKLLKKKDGFYLSQTPEGYLGWIESGSIKTGNKEFIENWDKSKKLIYTDIFGLVYSAPNEKSDPVTDIVVAGVMQYESLKNGWYKVKTLKDETGYIKEKSAMDLEKWNKTRKATPESIIKTGRRFLGFPYLWGGYSSKGLDCSGFVKTTFWLNGIMLPRDANQQGLLGEDISKGTDFENVKKGDLLFFGSRGKEGEPKITHVAIYIGNQEFIHCAAYVQISSFRKDSKDYDPWHCEKLLCIKRILK
jgi:gamma-D-glutamyl-L-lysine dipeptidyl-peptidase